MLWLDTSVLVSLYVPEARSARVARLVEEVDRLLVHGVLHLVGYDHERSKKEARRMRRKERELLE
jgi:rRNA maturation RNase YbeY